MAQLGCSRRKTSAQYKASKAARPSLIPCRTLRSPKGSWSGQSRFRATGTTSIPVSHTRVERSLLGEVQHDVEIVCRVAGLGRRKGGAGGILGEGFDQGHDRDPLFPAGEFTRLIC